MKQKHKQILYGLLVAANLLFIWGNSMLPASASSELSGGLLAFLGGFGEFAETVLRKIAHFSEFACLGLLICRLLQVSGNNTLSMPLLLGILAALADETIQTMVPERGPSVIDVWIDTAGIFAGIAVLILGQYVIRKLKQHNGGKHK